MILQFHQEVAAAALTFDILDYSRSKEYKTAVTLGGRNLTFNILSLKQIIILRFEVVRAQVNLYLHSFTYRATFSP